jgi:hypothetical protein
MIARAVFLALAIAAVVAGAALAESDFRARRLDVSRTVGVFDARHDPPQLVGRIRIRADSTGVTFLVWTSPAGGMVTLGVPNNSGGARQSFGAVDGQAVVVPIDRDGAITVGAFKLGDAAPEWRLDVVTRPGAIEPPIPSISSKGYPQ